MWLNSAGTGSKLLLGDFTLCGQSFGKWQGLNYVASPNPGMNAVTSPLSLCPDLFARAGVD